MDETHQASVRKILVAIDTSPHGSAALKAATSLATELRAELHGLFIEDMNLIRLAGLPFASEIDCSSGVCRPLDIVAMERTLQTAAEGVRRAISETAQRLRLRWSFRVFRGNVAQTMLTESLEADLILIGREESSLAPWLGTANQGPVMIIDEGARSNDRLFDMAQRLARQYADIIVSLLICESPASRFEHADQTSSFYVQRCSSNFEALSQAVRQWRPQILFVNRSCPLVSELAINGLVTQLPCPLALVQ